MADEQTIQDPNSTQPMQEGLVHVSQFNQLPIDPASAVASFMEWLQNREILVGPFSAHYNAEAGNALVKQFCDAQGWTLEDTQVEQVKTLREKYPE